MAELGSNECETAVEINHQSSLHDGSNLDSLGIAVCGFIGEQAQSIQTNPPPLSARSQTVGVALERVFAL